MTAEEFVAWAAEQPESQRYELAAKTAGLTCEAFPDGVALRVDAHTVYEPDAMLRCGPPLPGDTVLVEDPMIVVEVFSPSTGGADTGIKLADYFRVPSIRHYLLVRPGHRTIIHHARDDTGTITTRILGDGPLRLDPPGIVLDGLFSPA